VLRQEWIDGVYSDFATVLAAPKMALACELKRLGLSDMERRMSAGPPKNSPPEPQTSGSGGASGSRAQ